MGRARGVERPGVAVVNKTLTLLCGFRFFIGYANLFKFYYSVVGNVQSRGGVVPPPPPSPSLSLLNTMCKCVCLVNMSCCDGSRRKPIYHVTCSVPADTIQRQPRLYRVLAGGEAGTLVRATANAAFNQWHNVNIHRNESLIRPTSTFDRRRQTALWVLAATAFVRLINNVTPPSGYSAPILDRDISVI